MKAADLSQPVARKREGKVRWCKSAAMLLLLACAGCLSMPNGYNGTLYLAPYGKPVPTIGIGVSGDITYPQWLRRLFGFR